MIIKRNPYEKNENEEDNVTIRIIKHRISKPKLDSFLKTREGTKLQ